MSTPDGGHGWYTPPSPHPSDRPSSPPGPPLQRREHLPVPAEPYAPPYPVQAPPSYPPSGPPVGVPVQAWGPPAAWGPRLASPGARLGAFLLDVVLGVVTLGIGWLVWSLVVWGQGTTPAKSLLKQRVVSSRTGATATWGHMFVRQVLVGLLTGLLDALTFYVYGLVDALMVFSHRNQRLTDRIASTLVLQD